MASKNRLLGSGKPVEEVEEIEKVEESSAVEPSAPVRLPAWRYHKTCREGVLVQTQAELEKYKAEDGWTDHPGKIFRLPGHEHLYEGPEEGQ